MAEINLVENPVITMEKTMMIYAIKKKSQAKVFKNSITGDRIRFSIDIKPVGGAVSGTHAAYIKYENLRTKEYEYSSFNQLPKILNSFVLHEIEGE